jgi:hypothetical protein
MKRQIITVLIDGKEMALIPLERVPVIDKANVFKMPELWGSILPLNDKEALVMVMYKAVR